MEKLRGHAYGFLRWTEKYFKTDMVYAASGGFWLVLGQGASVLSSLILAIAFANLLPAELYGNYKYIIAVTGVLGVFTLTGIGTALTRFVARGHEGVLKKAYRMTLVWSTAILIASTGLAVYYFLNQNLTLGVSFLITAGTLPFISAASLYRPYLIGKKDFMHASMYGAIQAGITTIAIVGVLLVSDNVIALIAANFISNALSLYTLYRLVVKNETGPESQEPLLGSMGKHISVMNLISTFAGKLDSILVFQFIGGAELAVFAFATAIPDTIRGSLKNIASLAVPKFAGKEKEELKKSVYQKTYIIWGITFILAVFYIVAAPYIFSIFFPAYMSSVLYSQVYAVTIVMSLVLSSAYFDSQVAIKERYFLNIVSAVAMITTTVVGIYFFGIWGAIFARIAARIIIVIASGATLARH